MQEFTPLQSKKSTHSTCIFLLYLIHFLLEENAMINRWMLKNLSEAMKIPRFCE